MGRAAIGVALVLFASNPAWAGLYNPAEPHEGQLQDDYLGRFHFTLGELRNLNADKVEFDYPLRKRYWLQSQIALESVPPNWSVDYRLSLSAYLTRRKKLTEARQLLQPFASGRQENFLVLANLGTIYQLLEEWPRAQYYLESCLQAWPRDWKGLTPSQQAYFKEIGWNEGSFAWYRLAETYHVKLVRLRGREAALGKNKNRFALSIDALFDDGGSPPQPLRLVGDSGQFEAGPLPKPEQAKLPKEAVAIVQQLLVWLPDDPRLAWLLGELYNAQGKVKTAKAIFHDLVVVRQLRFRELLDHRQVLSQFQEKEEGPDPAKILGEIKTTAEEQGKKKQAEEETGTTVAWRSLGVGFVGGVVAAFFAYWQVREIGRRRAAAHRRPAAGDEGRMPHER